MTKHNQVDTPNVASGQDRIILSVALLIFAASIVGYYYFSEVHAVLRVLGLLAGVGVSMGLAYMTPKGKAWVHYLKSVKREVSLVKWPDRKETQQMTLIVFVVVIIMGIFLWLVDMFFLWAVQLLTGQGG
jgi:preprotein translocase subunit SecE